MKDKKDRNETLYYRTKGAVSNLSFTYDPKTGEFTLHEADPESVRVEKSYKRESGKDKVLGAVFTNSNKASFSLNDAAKNNYDYAIAVDTNSKLYKGKKISVCTSYAVPDPLRKYDNQIPFSHLASYILVNVRDEVNPELIGWNLIIKSHLRKAYKKSKFVVFVDSEKDSLEYYNSGVVPLFGGEFIPDNVKLCYASDKENDSLQGQMIKMCHNVANSIYHGINKDSVINSDLTNGSDFLEGYLFVNGIRGGIS